ncbi:Tc5 transposase DNA-binding domain protein [Toxoplasma gondii RUB]|uniref:Tc5 transposase DNA-binding domain protein n=1 Tax=Toxoplasma gondii RUB TaxID=935652 RepID=A0A086LNY2_TOXGO|nr:Tc5 transposase DNA-binding domain protein [Toxoplasma gondii RUB]
MAQSATTQLDSSAHRVEHLLQRAGSAEGGSSGPASSLSSAGAAAPLLMPLNSSEGATRSTAAAGGFQAHGHLSASHAGPAVFFNPSGSSEGNALVALPSSLPSVSLPLSSSHVDLSQVHPGLSEAHGGGGAAAGASASSHLLSQIGASSLLLLTSPGVSASSAAVGAKGTVPAGSSVGQGILFPQASGATLIANPGAAGPSLIAVSSAPFSGSHPQHAAFLASQGQAPAAWVVDAGGVSFSGPFAVGAPVSGLATAGTLARRGSPQPSPTAFSSSSFYSPPFQAVPTHEGGVSALAAAIAAVKVEPNAVEERAEARDATAQAETLGAEPRPECATSPTHLVLSSGASSPHPSPSSLTVSSSVPPASGLLGSSGFSSSFASAAPVEGPAGAQSPSEGREEPSPGSTAACLLSGDAAPPSGNVLLSPTVGSFERDLARGEGAAGAVAFEALDAQCRPGQAQSECETAPTVFFGRQELGNPEGSGVQAGLLSTHPSSQPGLAVVSSPILSASFPSFSSSFAPFPSSALTAVTVERLAALAAAVAGGGPAAPGVAQAVPSGETLGFLGAGAPPAVGDANAETPDAAAGPQFATGTQGPEGQAAGKRPRGRPRGSKNKCPRTATRATPGLGPTPDGAASGADAGPAREASQEVAAAETAETGEAPAEASPGAGAPAAKTKRRAGVRKKRADSVGDSGDSGAPAFVSSGPGDVEPTAFVMAHPAGHEAVHGPSLGASGSPHLPATPEGPAQGPDKEAAAETVAEAPGAEGPACGAFGPPCGAKDPASFSTTTAASCADGSGALPGSLGGGSGLEVPAPATFSAAGEGEAGADSHSQGLPVVLVSCAAEGAPEPGHQAPEEEPDPQMRSPERPEGEAAGSVLSAPSVSPPVSVSPVSASASVSASPAVSDAPAVSASPSPSDGGPAALVKADAAGERGMLSGEALAWRGLGMIKAGGIRKSYSASFKLAVVAAAEGMSSNTKAAKQMGVTESLVRRWRMQKAVLEQLPGEKLSRRGRKHGKYVTLEQQLCLHVCAVQQQEGRILKDTEMRRLASEIAGNLAVSDFKASSTWCFRFKRRWGLDRVQNLHAGVVPPKRIQAPLEPNEECVVGNPVGPGGTLPGEETGVGGEAEAGVAAGAPAGPADPKKADSGLNLGAAAGESLGVGDLGMASQEGPRPDAQAGAQTQEAARAEGETLALGARGPSQERATGDTGSGASPGVPAEGPPTFVSFSAAPLAVGLGKENNREKEKQVLFLQAPVDALSGIAAQSLPGVSGTFVTLATAREAPAGIAAQGLAQLQGASASSAFASCPALPSHGFHDRAGAPGAVARVTGQAPEGLGAFQASFSSGTLPLAFLTPALSTPARAESEREGGSENGDTGNTSQHGALRPPSPPEGLCLLLPEGASQAEQELALQRKLVELQRQQEALEREIEQHRVHAQAFEGDTGEAAGGAAAGNHLPPRTETPEGTGLASPVASDGRRPEEPKPSEDTQKSDESLPGASHATLASPIHTSSPASPTALQASQMGAGVEDSPSFASSFAVSSSFVNSPSRREAGDPTPGVSRVSSAPATAGDRGSEHGDRAETETVCGEGRAGLLAQEAPKQASSGTSTASFSAFPFPQNPRERVAFASSGLAAEALSSLSGPAVSSSALVSAFPVPAPFAVSFAPDGRVTSGDRGEAVSGGPPETPQAQQISGAGLQASRADTVEETPGAERARPEETPQK